MKKRKSPSISPAAAGEGIPPPLEKGEKKGDLFFLGLFSVLFLVGCSENAVLVKDNPCAEFTAENFSTQKIFSGTPLPVNISTHPEAGRFAKELLENAKNTPNFAGNYEVISWECGENCQRHAVVDLRTGRIIFLGLESQFGAEFSPSSRVLTMNPEKSLPSLKKFPEEIRTQYWLMEGGEDDIATEFSLGCEANLRQY